MGRNQHCHYWRLNGGTCSLSARGCPCRVLPRLWASAVNCPQEFFYLLRQLGKEVNKLQKICLGGMLCLLVWELLLEEDEEMNRKEYGRRRRIALSKRRPSSVNDSRYQTSPRMISRMVPEGFDIDE